MAFDAGSIVIELTAKDGGFTASVKNAGTSMREFKVQADQTALSVKRLEAHQFSLATQFRHTIVTLGALRFAAMDLNDIFLRLPAAILKSAGSLEQTQALLSGLSKQLSKSARDAEGALDFKYITNFAQNAPFTVKSLADTFVKLKVAGLDPAAGSLSTLVDAVARFGGSSETLQRASIALQQMSGKGVVSMEELRQQLGEAVPTAMRSMAIGMGLSMNELTKVVSKGTVEAQSAMRKMFVIMAQDNRGAAAELMDTWNGTLSRLKTRLELAAKDVYDSGFGEAIRKIASELSEGLNSNEFKRFSVEFGLLLGRSVTNIGALAKGIYEWAGAIKTVVIAWIAYKVASSFVVPFGNAMLSTFSNLKTAYREEAFRSAARVSGLARESAAAVASNQEILASKVASTSGYLAASRAELAAGAAEIAQLEAKALAWRTAIAASVSAGRGVNSQDGGRAISRAAAVAKIAEIETAAAAQIAAQRRIERSVSDNYLAFERATTNVKGYAAATTSSAAATSAGAVAMARLATAGRAVGAAFMAINGPMLLVNAVIAAGVYIWQTWESAADKAARAGERAARAQRGLSDESDRKATEEAVKAAQEKVADAERKLANAEINPGNNPLRAEAAAQQRAILAQARVDLAKLLDEDARHKKNIGERNAKADADVVAGGAQKFIDSIYAWGRERQVAIDKVAEDEVKAAGTNQAKIAAASKKQGDARLNLEVQIQQKQVDGLNAAKKSVESNAASLGKDAFKLSIDDYNAKIITANQALAAAKLALKANVFVTKDDKKDNATPDDPLKDLIIRLKSTNAELLDQASTLKDNFGKVDDVLTASAKIIEKARLGGFNYGKDKEYKPSAQQIQEAAEFAENNALIKRGIRDAESFASIWEDLGPRYLEAAAQLGDPLGTTKRGTEETKTEKFLRNLSPARLAAMASQLGTTVDAIKASIGKGAVIDASADFIKIAQDTRAIQDSITEISKEGIRKRREADIEAFRHKEQLKVDRVLLEQGESIEVQNMQTILNANIVAQNKKLRHDLRSPMELMVEQWENSTDAMNAATASWANQTMDMFVQSAKTGKLEWKSLVINVLADLLKIRAQKALAGSFDSIFTAIGSYASSLFADGGIMTQSGAVPLRAYAAGGIANSPQMAVFGEGSMSEAYVPLPDGRSIPVTLSQDSGSGTNVVVNVINQTSQSVTAKQGQPRFDGKQMILDVVLEGVGSPGQFRDGMKSMMSTP